MSTEDLEVSFEGVQCPYCGEWIDVQVDPSGGSSQSFVSDCDVCCKPIDFLVRVDREGAVRIEGRRDSEGHF